MESICSQQTRHMVVVSLMPAASPKSELSWEVSLSAESLLFYFAVFRVERAVSPERLEFPDIEKYPFKVPCHIMSLLELIRDGLNLDDTRTTF